MSGAIGMTAGVAIGGKRMSSSRVVLWEATPQHADEWFPEQECSATVADQ